MAQNEKMEPGYFDIPYGIASVALTVGHNSVSTVGGVYYGVALKVSAADCTVIVYDHASTTSGNLMDLVVCDFSESISTRAMLQMPIKAKNGIQVDVSETGTKGVVFYAPEG